jgi:hypothetical protein
MRPEKLPSGNYLLPMRAEGPGVIGDGMVEVPPDDPALLRELAWWEEFDKRSGKTLTESK